MMDTLSLDGTWRIRFSDGERGKREHAEKEQTDWSKYIDATVPGEVHLDLMRAGWIADPAVGNNILSARWVEQFHWSYRRHFTAPPQATCAAAPAGARAWLVFEGLDYTATILLNGQEIGRHDNFYRPCRIEVTGRLREGDNYIVAHLEAGYSQTAEKPGQGYLGHGHRYGPKRHWLRKPQCQFGWDWAPQLANVGIHKPVRLEWTTDSARLDQVVPLVELSEDLSRGTVRVRAFIEGLGGEVAGKVQAEIVGTGASGETAVQIREGTNIADLKIEISDPKPWWPAGHGEQQLYTLRVAVTAGGRAIGRREFRIGFRHVRFNQQPHPAGGRYFVLEVNGRPIFCKGGNLVPADFIYARVDRARYARLVELALEANFNFLRVWGGGLYENDDFYDICDEKGILVWQEFIFACERYPTTDEAFMANVKAEVVHQVRRLAGRASLVAWCGNNEMEWGAWDWGWDRTGVIHPDYALFHLVLPRILAAEDPGRYYQPSSPWSPDGLHPNRDDVGDQHPWSIGFSNTDFRGYRRMACRFPNEGGILGPTSLPTVLACLPEGQRRHANLAWQMHDNTIDSWGEPSFPDEMIRLWLGKDIQGMTVEEYVYWAGLVQGEGLREYCENFRRRMFDSASAIFWMYNDTWPAVRSWTIVDYYLRRTPSFHPVRRALAPVSVVLAEQDGQVVAYGINETRQAVAGELRLGLFHLAGGLPVDRRLTVELPPNTSTALASFGRELWAEAARTAAFAVLSGPDGGLLARNRLILPLFKELTWPEARVRVRVAGDQAIFSSPTFAWGVCLDLDGDRPLADNFFDIYPGMDYAIPWPQAEAPKVLRVANLGGR